MYDKLYRLSPPMNAPAYFEWVARTRDSQKALKPWTLLQLPGEDYELVARRRNVLTRVLTWWLNIGRAWTRRAYWRSFARRSHRQ